MMTRTNFRFFRYMVPVMVVLVLIGFSFSSTLASGYPSISITSVDPGKSVTITGANFPTGQTFTARMGKYGNYGLDGVVAGTVDTAASSTFTQTFTIPADLAGEESVAIRLDSAEGYYAFNWFYNAPEPVEESVSPETSNYMGHPTFSISDVERNLAVGIETANLPAGKTFTVLMGEYLTRGIGGIEVGTLDSKAGGVLKSTFTIPAELMDRERIAIRLDSADGFYAYNWFWNYSTGAAATGGTVEGTAYSGIPAIVIDAVQRDKSVSLSGSNFPSGETFMVTMGYYGEKGTDGFEAGSYTSSNGGEFNQSFTIPPDLAGSYLIAIRMETESGAFYAYNWFFNTTTEPE